MTQAATLPQTKTPDPHQDTFSKNVLGFWVYLMTDCMIFGTLFATYAILHHSTFGGPSGRDLFSLPLVVAETAVLLLSSVIYGFGTLASCRNQKGRVLAYLILAFLLGTSFVTMEVHEFSGLVREGNSWQRSAFLSSFFTLVGTHGFHVSTGLFWMIVLMIQIGYMGITIHTFRRLVILGMFWHFLDLIWIFIFTFVYLMGVI
jgi:cytochrome o ubiquinol oxidase subunit III